MKNHFLFFLQLHIIGGGSLEISGVNVGITAQKIIGDGSGRLSVKSQQFFQIKAQRERMHFALLAQPLTDLTLPDVLECRKVDIILKGEI